MTIDKAIKLIKMLLDSTILDPLPHNKEAVELGIEALKRLIKNRNYYLHDVCSLLPGETEK